MAPKWERPRLNLKTVTSHRLVNTGSIAKQRSVYPCGPGL